MWPKLFAMVGSAPWASNNSAHFFWSQKMATASGVQPLASLRLGFVQKTLAATDSSPGCVVGGSMVPWCVSRKAQSSTCPCCAARCRHVPPRSSRAVFAVHRGRSLCVVANDTTSSSNFWSCATSPAVAAPTTSFRSTSRACASRCAAVFRRSCKASSICFSRFFIRRCVSFSSHASSTARVASFDAMSKGRSKSRFVIEGSAPLFSSNVHIAENPPKAARQSGVLPRSDCEFGSAPSSSKYVTSSPWPCAAASLKGVLSRASTEST